MFPQTNGRRERLIKERQRNNSILVQSDKERLPQILKTGEFFYNEVKSPMKRDLNRSMDRPSYVHNDGPRRLPSLQKIDRHQSNRRQPEMKQTNNLTNQKHPANKTSGKCRSIPSHSEDVSMNIGNNSRSNSYSSGSYSKSCSNTIADPPVNTTSFIDASTLLYELETASPINADEEDSENEWTEKHCNIWENILRRRPQQIRFDDVIVTSLDAGSVGAVLFALGDEDPMEKIDRYLMSLETATDLELPFIY